MYGVAPSHLIRENFPFRSPSILLSPTPSFISNEKSSVWVLGTRQNLIIFFTYLLLAVFNNGKKGGKTIAREDDYETKKGNKRTHFFCSTPPLPPSSQGFSEVARSHHHHREKLANRMPRSRQFLKQKARFSQMTVNSLWSFASTSLSLLPHSPFTFFFLPSFEKVVDDFALEWSDLWPNDANLVLAYWIFNLHYSVKWTKYKNPVLFSFCHLDR